MTKFKPDIELIIDHLKAHPGISSKEIYDATSVGLVSYVTLQRLLKDLVQKNFISAKGSGKGTKYEVSPAYQVIHEINLADYFKKEIDERVIRKEYNFDLIKNTLNKIDLFTSEELEKLNGLQA